MPKTQSLKVLRREDFVYAHKHPTSSPSSSSTISNNAFNKPKYGLHGARTPLQSESTPKNSAEVDIANNGRIDFPLDSAERQKYKTKSGKRLTHYQWNVYDFILRIPRGKVTTYKIVSDSIGGSARSAGGALKNNPFSPYVPCHRVVASNLFIGGFCGQWAGRKSSHASNTNNPGDKEQSQIKRKIELLKEENVQVDERGFLVAPESVIWRPD